MVEQEATFSVHATAKQRLVIVKQSFVYLEDIVAAVLYEILHDNVELIAVSQGKPGFHKQFPGFIQWQLKSHSQSKGCLLLGLVGHIVVYLGEKLLVNIRPLIAVGILHPLFCNLSEQHLRKALVNHIKLLIQSLTFISYSGIGHGCHGVKLWSRNSKLMKFMGKKLSAPAVMVRLGVVVIYVLLNAGE